MLQNYCLQEKLVLIQKLGQHLRTFYIQLNSQLIFSYFCGWTLIWQSIIIKFMASINQTFLKFVEEIQTNGSVFQAIEYAQQLYSLKTHKINQITVPEALKIYQAIYLKFYKGHSQTIKTNWYQNQLRIFVWAIVCYIFLHKLKIQELGEPDWDYFEKLFDRKDRGLFEYQCKYLCANTKGKNWSKQEQQLLRKIMENKINTAKWNEVSKELFQISQKKFFRTAKQCRQRWNNHLDPTKIKGFWKAQQCLVMFQYVKQHGKKWANLVKLLNETRNQHAIKNKFNSIIKKHRKTSNSESENQIYNQIIARIKKMLENRAIYQNADFSFDIQDCQEQLQIRNERTQNLNLQNGCHKTTQNFLKILQKYNSESNEGSSKSELKLQQNQKTLIQGSRSHEYQQEINNEAQPASGRRVEVYAYPVLFYKLLSSHDKPNNCINTGYHKSMNQIPGLQRNYPQHQNPKNIHTNLTKQPSEPNMYLPYYYNMNNPSYNGNNNMNMNMNPSNMSYKIESMGLNINERNLRSQWKGQDNIQVKEQIKSFVQKDQQIYQQYSENEK